MLFMPLLAGADRFFLAAAGWAGCAGEDAEDFVFFHDDEVFAVNFDLGSGILAEQDAIVLVKLREGGFAFIVGAAFAGWKPRWPSCGLSFALSGMMIPPRVVDASSTRRTRMRSCSGLNLAMVATPFKKLGRRLTLLKPMNCWDSAGC